MELKILHWFEELHNPVLDFLMYQITCLGNGGLIWLVIAAAMLFVLPKRYRKTGATVVAALLISLVICNGIMKNLYQRVRPFHADPTFENLYRVFDRIYDWSFPSGHTSASFAAAVAIRLWNKKEGIGALVLAALISFSRLYLTVHYPTDVLASVVFGSAYGGMAYSFASSFVLGTRSSSQSISRKISFSIISLIWIYIDFSCVKISFILLLIPYAS